MTNCKHRAGLILLALAAAVLPAQAAERPAYGAVLGHAVIPDGDRDGDEGYGFRLVYGVPLNSVLDLELNGGNHFVQRQGDRQFDVFYNLGLDLKLNLQPTGDFAPFVIGGLGAAREDEFTEQEVRPYANLGLGFVYALPISNIALRAESRYHLVYGGDDAVSETFGDVEFNVGIQFAFDNAGSAARDSDGDGVRDVNDLCPGTPPGTVVDATGCPAQPTLLVVPAPVVVADTDTDADDDGVPDGLDACAGTAKGLLVDATGCVVAQTTVLQGVQFETNSSRLSGSSMEILTAVAGSLQIQPGLRLEISGHTDSLGPQSNNLTLSLNRAKAVEDFLIKQGVNTSRLQSEGYGEFIPVDTNETEEGRAKNRRVEFKVLTAPLP